MVKVGIPPTHLAFQIGETAQIHSGGYLQVQFSLKWFHFFVSKYYTLYMKATPHAVRGSSKHGISRQTFAVFMQPNWDEPVQVIVALNFIIVPL